MNSFYPELLYHSFIILKNKLLDKTILEQKGQTLVEFMLLLSVLVLTSLVFLSTINTGIAHLWESLGRILVEDPLVPIKVR